MEFVLFSEDYKNRVKKKLLNNNFINQTICWNYARLMEYAPIFSPKTIVQTIKNCLYCTPDKIYQQLNSLGIAIPLSTPKSNVQVTQECCLIIVIKLWKW